MKFLVLAFVLISAAASAHADDLTELDPKTFYTANGGMYLSLNSTTLVLGLIGLAAVAGLLYFAFVFLQANPAYEKSGNYYDHDLIAADNPYANEALAYAVSAQQQQQAHRQKRSTKYTSNLATKMQQLEAVFKKFAVETEECQQFVSCEAAQLRKLNRNVPIVQIVNRILSVRGEEEKLNPRILEAFNNGLIASNNYVANACQAYREQCYVAHNNNQ